MTACEWELVQSRQCPGTQDRGQPVPVKIQTRFSHNYQSSGGHWALQCTSSCREPSAQRPVVGPVSPRKAQLWGPRPVALPYHMMQVLMTNATPFSSESEDQGKDLRSEAEDTVW